MTKILTFFFWIAKTLWMHEIFLSKMKWGYSILSNIRNHDNVPILYPFHIVFFANYCSFKS